MPNPVRIGSVKVNVIGYQSMRSVVGESSPSDATQAKTHRPHADGHFTVEIRPGLMSDLILKRLALRVGAGIGRHRNPVSSYVLGAWLETESPAKTMSCYRGAGVMVAELRKLHGFDEWSVWAHLQPLDSR
jgi:hypothetical protein